jgi:hypothetical protein
MSRRIKLADFSQDDRNFNRHTEEGMALLGKSVDEVGILEAITVSSDGKVISGNARHEVIGEKFAGVEPIVVETDGQTPVVIKRTDIASNTAAFHTAALLANTVSKKNIDLDNRIIRKVSKQYSIDIQELGIDIVKPPYAYKELVEVVDSNVIFPITILQNENQALIFSKIKDYLKKNDFYVFNEILNFYYSQKNI